MHFLILFLILVSLTGVAQVMTFTTTADKTKLFETQTLLFAEGAASSSIRLNPEKRFQQMEGFGAALTGSSCYNLLRMRPEERKKLLQETFDRRVGMGWSFIRITVGCSDFSLDEYTYCDKPGIENFALTVYETRDLIPVLKEILAINPNVKILASPWTCPKWMKVNNLKERRPHDHWTSGHLNPAYYNDYATYFVKFIQAMKGQGIEIEAITIQNEPLNRGNSASLFMGWDEQRDFIKQALGPKLKASGLKARIWVFDHNFNYDKMSDQQQYPLKIYNDPEAAQYIDGSAWHAYGGEYKELDKIQAAYPAKGIYFAEIAIGEWSYDFAGDLMWASKNVAIGTIQRGCKAVMVWNYMLDDLHAPNRPGGCTNCFGCVDIDSQSCSKLDRRSHYYLISHLAKVIHAGSTRVDLTGDLPANTTAIAVENPNGTYGVFIRAGHDKPLTMCINDGKKSFMINLPPKSLVSAIWRK
jgi:glucosylceramidase